MFVYIISCLFTFYYKLQLFIYIFSCLFVIKFWNFWTKYLVLSQCVLLVCIIVDYGKRKEMMNVYLLPDLWWLFGPWSMALVSGLRSSRWRLFLLAELLTPWAFPADYKKKRIYYIFFPSLFLVSCQRHSLCIAMTYRKDYYRIHLRYIDTVIHSV